jgi:hypothetical protein
MTKGIVSALIRPSFGMLNRQTESSFQQYCFECVGHLVQLVNQQHEPLRVLQRSQQRIGAEES